SRNAQSVASRDAIRATTTHGSLDLLFSTFCYSKSVPNYAHLAFRQVWVRCFCTINWVLWPTTIRKILIRIAESKSLLAGHFPRANDSDSDLAQLRQKFGQKHTNLTFSVPLDMKCTMGLRLKSIGPGDGV